MFDEDEYFTSLETDSQYEVRKNQINFRFESDLYFFSLNLKTKMNLFGKLVIWIFPVLSRLNWP